MIPQLADIGLTRADVRAEATRAPVWDVPSHWLA
jgi:uncharacterized protein YjiS (DUF1127 family)